MKRRDFLKTARYAVWRCRWDPFARRRRGVWALSAGAAPEITSWSGRAWRVCAPLLRLTQGGDAPGGGPAEGRRPRRDPVRLRGGPLRRGHYAASLRPPSPRAKWSDLRPRARSFPAGASLPPRAEARGQAPAGPEALGSPGGAPGLVAGGRRRGGSAHRGRGLPSGSARGPRKYDGLHGSSPAGLSETRSAATGGFDDTSSTGDSALRRLRTIALDTGTPTTRSARK